PRLDREDWMPLPIYSFNSIGRKAKPRPLGSRHKTSRCIDTSRIFSALSNRGSAFARSFNTLPSSAHHARLLPESSRGKSAAPATVHSTTTTATRRHGEFSPKVSARLPGRHRRTPEQLDALS